MADKNPSPAPAQKPSRRKQLETALARLKAEKLRYTQELENLDRRIIGLEGQIAALPPTQEG